MDIKPEDASESTSSLSNTGSDDVMGDEVSTEDIQEVEDFLGHPDSDNESTEEADEPEMEVTPEPATEAQPVDESAEMEEAELSDEELENFLQASSDDEVFTDEQEGETDSESDSEGQPYTPPWQRQSTTSDSDTPRSAWDTGWRCWLNPRKLQFWVVAAVIIAILLPIFLVGGDDGDQPNGDNAQTGTVEPTAETEIFCGGLMQINLDEVGVPRWGDRLTFADVRSLQSMDTEATASDIMTATVDQLFDSVGDGCTPAGIAYWRNISPHVIDANRAGIDNHDAGARVSIYSESTTLASAVAQEIHDLMSQSCQASLVNLTEEETPIIWLAAYARDYSDVVFVQTPLLGVDELADGRLGVTAVRCSFGQLEGGASDNANTILISPTLRALVYLDRPTGSQIFVVEPTEEADEPEMEVTPEPATEAQPVEPTEECPDGTVVDPFGNCKSRDTSTDVGQESTTGGGGDNPTGQDSDPVSGDDDGRPAINPDSLDGDEDDDGRPAIDPGPSDDGSGGCSSGTSDPFGNCKSEDPGADF